jgi:sodium/hydrogen antiporter
MWPVAGTVVALALFPRLDLWTAAALATMLAPTDAALGLPVVTNPRLPSRVRQGLNVESGLNDGVCVPLLIVFLTIAQAEEGVGHVEPLRVILEEIGFGVAAGVVAGALGGWVLRLFARRGWMEGTWRQITAVATALLAYTAAAALGGSGFLLFGALLLGPALGGLDWRVGLYAVASLTVVRMLTVVTWTVALSVYAHGLTAWPGANRYADWYDARHEDHKVMPESVPVAEQRAPI